MIDVNPNNYRNHTSEEGMYGCFGYVVGAILALVICALIGSCKAPCYITEADSIHDTCFITKVQRDSIYQHDSVYVHEYTKGDTVHVDKVRWMVSYRDRLAHDTLYIHEIDTVTKTVTIEPKKETIMQKIKRHIGDFFEVLAILAAFAVGILVIMWIRGK